MNIHIYHIFSVNTSGDVSVDLERRNVIHDAFQLVGIQQIVFSGIDDL